MEVGIEYNVQIVSTDKLTELTIRKEAGKPAPEFDSFIWGWGGDPYDPSFLLEPDDDRRDRRVVGRLLLEPRVRPAVRGADHAVRHQEERKAVIQEMIAILQEDLPYIVLTYDPYLEAYNSDALGGVERLCPAETGTAFCQQVSYEPILSLEPGEASSEELTTGVPGGVVAIGAVGGRDRAPSCSAARAGAGRSSRWRWKREGRRVNARWIAGKVGAALLTLVFVLIFNFFLFRGLGDPTDAARPPAADEPARRSSSCVPSTASTSP